jgi:hypothetical protein
MSFQNIRGDSEGGNGTHSDVYSQGERSYGRDLILLNFNLLNANLFSQGRKIPSTHREMDRNKYVTYLNVGYVIDFLIYDTHNNSGKNFVVITNAQSNKISTWGGYLHDSYYQVHSTIILGTTSS